MVKRKRVTVRRGGKIVVSRKKFTKADTRSGGFQNLELKFLDQRIGSTSIAALLSDGMRDPGSGVDCLNGIAQGDSESERNGRKYVIKSYHIRGEIRKDQATGLIAFPRGVHGFVALVLDTQTNKAQMTGQDVFNNTGHDPLAFRNLETSKRFKVLKRMTYSFTNQNMQTQDEVVAPGTVVFGTAGQIETFEWNGNVNIPVICTGTTGTIAAINDNSLHMVAVASNSSVPDIVKLRYESRLRFVG